MSNDNSSSSSGATSGGFSIIALVGAVMAGWCSWTLHQSVFWAGVHTICGWWYLLYLCLGCNGQSFPVGFY